MEIQLTVDFRRPEASWATRIFRLAIAMFMSTIPPMASYLLWSAIQDRLSMTGTAVGLGAVVRPWGRLQVSDPLT